MCFNQVRRLLCARFDNIALALADAVFCQIGLSLRR
jgi:hypothetical protein